MFSSGVLHSIKHSIYHFSVLHYILYGLQVIDLLCASGQVCFLVMQFSSFIKIDLSEYKCGLTWVLSVVFREKSCQ